MKTAILKYSLLIVFLLTNTIALSQSENGTTHFINEMIIDYDSGLVRSRNGQTGKETLIPNIVSFENISRIRFLNDSLINISGDKLAGHQLNINKIEKMSIKTGTYLGEGAVCGLLIGLIAGAIIGSSVKDEHTTKGDWFHVNPPTVGAILGVPAGAIIGAIIGGSISSYDTYSVLGNKYQFNRVINMGRKTN